MTLFDWIQAGIDVLALIALGFHRHPVYWRRWS